MKLPLDQSRINEQVRDRLRHVERLAVQAGRPPTEEVATFSSTGAITVSTSGKHRVRVGGQIVAVWFDSTDVGTGSTVFDIWLDGVALGSGVTVTSGLVTLTSYLGDYRAAPGQTLQVDVTASGSHPDPVIRVVMKG